MNNKITTKTKKLIANIPMKFAKLSANTTCTWLGYEVKAPKSLDKFKKHSEK